MTGERLTACRLPLAIGGRDGLDERLVVVAARAVERAPEAGAQVVGDLVRQPVDELAHLRCFAADRLGAGVDALLEMLPGDAGVAGDVVRRRWKQRFERRLATQPAERVEDLVLLVGQGTLEGAGEGAFPGLERR